MLITEECPNEIKDLGSKVELDPHNKRIKVYQMSENNSMDKIDADIKGWAKDRECDKIIFITDQNKKEHVQNDEYIQEGKIDGFFKGDDAYIYSYFLDSNRRKLVDEEQEQKVMDIVNNDKKSLTFTPLPEGYSLRKATEEDAPEMAKLYGQVFKTYPTPMDHPDFIVEIMNDNVHFTVVEYEGKLISACSADVFTDYNSAEMTDCATLPEHRGKGLLSHQFEHLEQDMQKMGVRSLFSYTRSVSVGMNLINSRHGYEFRGRLVQNTNISGRLEDMNIWVKTFS